MRLSVYQSVCLSLLFLSLSLPSLVCVFIYCLDQNTFFRFFRSENLQAKLNWYLKCAVVRCQRRRRRRCRRLCLVQLNGKKITNAKSTNLFIYYLLLLPHHTPLPPASAPFLSLAFLLTALRVPHTMLCPTWLFRRLFFCAPFCCCCTACCCCFLSGTGLSCLGWVKVVRHWWRGNTGGGNSATPILP